jgi:two-component system phosphate regulon sensor histidine kinase PhoR
MIRDAQARADSQRLPSGRLLGAAVVLSVPGVIVVAGLAVFGVLDPPWLVIPAVGAMVAGTALMVRPYLRDLQAVEHTARALVETSVDPSAPPVTTPEIVYSRLARGHMAAVQELRRACDRRVEALAARTESDALVVEGLPDPILLIDAKATVTRVNAAARALFGRDGAGRSLTVLLRDPRVLDAVEAVLAGGGGRTVQVTLAGPVERECEVRVAPLPQRDREGAEAMIAVHDVTKLVRLERMRADFVANASHELRTPLSSLVGFIETLMGPAREDAEARDRFLPIMMEQGRRMQRLVEDLLSLSRIEINEHSPPTDTVHLPDLIRDIATSLELKSRNKGMTMVLDLDPDLPSVVGEPDQLSQVFQNLLDNAIKYGRANTAITVSGGVVARAPVGMPGSRGPCLHVAVRDESEGIAREHLPRLTERFYRVDRARSRQMGGTGLGLAIVKHVLARHRGLLVPESTVGKGSTFNVYLPISTQAEAPPPVPLEALPRRPVEETAPADAERRQTAS